MSRRALSMLLGCTLALLLSACAQDASSLSPFPCALDQSCPSGLLCLPGTGCVKPQADALCAADADCGTGFECSLGHCDPTCQDGQGCATGRSCSGAKGAGVCLADCGSSQSCPGNLVCGALWQPGQTACLPDGTAFESPCSTEGAACGPPGANGICDSGKCELACANGTGCATDQLCTAQTGTGVCVLDCTAGATCPAGLACNGLWSAGKKGCLQLGVGLDLPCGTPGHCGPAGASAVCDLGRCEISSTNGAGCPSGRVPSTATGAGVCLIDCTSGGACPSGFSCNGPYADAKDYCVPTGSGINNTCTSTAECAPLGKGGSCDHGVCDLACSGGQGCPAGSLCAAQTGAASCVLDCTSGQTCPSGLSCTDFFSSGNKACLPPGEGSDQPCSSAGAACGPQGTGAVCGLGECELPCSATQACPSGRICTAATGNGVCVLDCSGELICPSGTACQTLHSGGHSGCAPGPVAACSSVSNVNGCPIISQCGSTSYWTVSCSGGGTCVEGSACEAPVNGVTQCECQHSFSYTCDSQSCATASCTYPNWSCRPATAEIIGCTDPAINSSGTCNCVDGRQLAVACGVQPNLTDVAAASCEYVCGKECDLVAQTGCTAPASKCAALRDGSVSLPTCVTPASTQVADGASCFRTGTGVASVGEDDCAPGSFCSDVGATGNLTCHRHCNASSDCSGSASGNACISIGGLVGICVPSVVQCPGSACGPNSGRTCSLYQIFEGTWTEQCRTESGTVAAGQPCNDEGDCLPGNTCQITSNSSPAKVCTQICSPTTPCTDSTLVCQGALGLASGTGWCF